MGFKKIERLFFSLLNNNNTSKRKRQQIEKMDTNQFMQFAIAGMLSQMASQMSGGTQATVPQQKTVETKPRRQGKKAGKFDTRHIPNGYINWKKVAGPAIAKRVEAEFQAAGLKFRPLGQTVEGPFYTGRDVQNEVMKRAGAAWKALPDAEKAPFLAKAKAAREALVAAGKEAEAQEQESEAEKAQESEALQAVVGYEDEAPVTQPQESEALQAPVNPTQEPEAETQKSEALQAPATPTQAPPSTPVAPDAPAKAAKEKARIQQMIDNLERQQELETLKAKLATLEAKRASN